MRKTRLLIVLLIVGLSGCTASESKIDDLADAVIFSFNRPLQLYALLESIEKYISGLNEIHVIYRASNQDYQHAYETVFSSFPQVITHQQGNDPKKDFKPLTLKASFESPAAYILFAVDDIIVKDSVEIYECTRALEEYHAYGFFLRLGTHLTDCYPTNSKQPVPTLKEGFPWIRYWTFGQATHDWAYPHTVDMTIYRKKDIKPFFEQLSFENPNTLEGNWAQFANYARNKIGICYITSKIVNLPLNRVQHVFANRAMQEFSAEDLLTIFNQNKKMDIAPLARIQNPSAHMEYTPTFISRS